MIEHNEKRIAYTVPEAAELTGLSTDRIYQLCREGNFPHRRVGERQVLIPKRGLERWLEGESASMPTQGPLEY